MVSMSRYDVKYLQQALSNNVLIHRVTHADIMTEALAAMEKQIHKREGLAFDGVRIDTAANRS